MENWLTMAMCKMLNFSPRYFTFYILSLSRISKFRGNQDLIYDYKVELTGIGNRSFNNNLDCNVTMFPGQFAPGSKGSSPGSKSYKKRKFQRVKVPRSESSMEGIGQRANWLGSEKALCLPATISILKVLLSLSMDRRSHAVTLAFSSRQHNTTKSEK